MPQDNQNTEPTIEESALDASLDALLKAAGAEDTIDKLSKGGQVYSGHVDERGAVGGGGASYGDAGGIETLMIGKLVEGGTDGALARSVVQDMMGLLTEAGLLGKQKDDDEEDDDEEEMTAYARGYAEAARKFGKSSDFEEGDDDETLAKSHREEFVEGSDNIAEGVDASPFMDDLVTRTTRSLDRIVKSMSKGEAKQSKVNRALAAAVYQQGQLIKSQAHVIDHLGQRLGVVEAQPAAAPKGARTLQQAQALSKSIPNELGAGQPEQLTKSQAARVLSYLRFEKGMENVNGEAVGDAACRAEAGGILSKSMDEYIRKYLATHPNEREAALNYA